MAKAPENEDSQKDKPIVIDIDYQAALYATLFLFLLIAAGFVVQSLYASEPQPASALPEPPADDGVVSAGDTLLVSYVGRFPNGTVFDTSREAVARQAGTYSQNRAYRPLSVRVGAGQTIPAFEQALIGMRVGEQKTITLPPERAYGQRSPANVIAQNRTRITSAVNEVLPDQYRATFGGEPVLGEVVTLPGAPWNLTVVAVNESVVQLQSNVEEETVIETEFGTTVVSPEGDSLVIRLAAVNESAVVATPVGYARVVNVTNDSISLDYNHPLAGETLVFDLAVESITG